jgi:hypothetical protein
MVGRGLRQRSSAGGLGEMANPHPSSRARMREEETAQTGWQRQRASSEAAAA